MMYVGVETSRYLSADLTPQMQRWLDAENRSPVLLSKEEREIVGQVSVGHAFVNDPLRLLFVWEGGLVMYGGLAGSMLLGVWAARRRNLHPWNALDTAMISGFVGQTIGRWGCLLVGDDYGSVVPAEQRDLPFPVTITVPDLPWLRDNPKSLFDHDLAGEVLWATQPWMSVNALGVALVGWLVLRRRRHFGVVTGVILIHYSVTRAVIENFRGDEVRGLWFDGAVSTSQLIALLGVLAGVCLLVTARRRPLPAAPAR
jgi:phosphatidylglycerol:prolipoprotein diacylglycerol transferase